MNRERLVVVGMGYVGIPAAVLFAATGKFEVVGVQRRSARSGWKIDLLNRGESPFPDNEPGIGELIRKVVENGSFRVTEDFTELKSARYVLIDVQTPVAEDHQPKYESLKTVSEQISGWLQPGCLVSIESTVAPGTTANLVRPILEEGSGLSAGRDFHLVFCYERVMVGRLLHNIQNYPRVVGGYWPACAQAGAELYKTITRAPVVPTDCLTAEVAKTVENAYRDVNIAFANEIALICESLGVNVFEVRELVNNLPNDPSNPAANPVRNMHIPGAGVGGHCLPKDSWLLKYGVDTYGKQPVDLRILVGARAVNSHMPIHMADLAEKALRDRGVGMAEARIVVLGYAFLEDSDDTRNTPAEDLLRELRRRGAKRVVVHDPYVRSEELPGVERDVYRAVAGADCACLVTRHSEYRNLDLRRLRESMRTPILVDGRNLFREGTEGFHLVGLGRSASKEL